MGKWTSEWEQMPLTDLRDAQTQLATIVKRKAAEAAPPRGWDPFLFGTKKYKASLAQVAPARIKETLSAYRACSFGVSLGSKNSEGARFEACLRWIAESFDRCAILVGDSIYRYTLQVTQNVPHEQSRTLALKKGQEFVQQYTELVRNYPGRCQFEFLLLSSVEGSPDFPRYHAELQRLYETDAPFRGLVAGFAEIYLGRGEKAPEEDAATFEKARNIAIAYLLEESALFCCLVDQGFPVLVYPGAIKTFQSIAEGEFPAVPKSLLDFVFVALRLKEGGLYFFDEQARPDFDSVFAQTETARERHAFLANRSEADLKRFFEYTEALSFAAGDSILRQGEVDRALHIVAEGEVEVVDKAKRRLAVMESGSVFGEQAFLDAQPRSASVVARSACRVLRLTPERFEDLRREEPEIACDLLRDVGRVLSARLRRTTVQSG